jgi:hypothetical protein
MNIKTNLKINIMINIKEIEEKEQLNVIISSPAEGVESKAVEPTISGRGREGGRVVEAAR